jgi:hypothetical protein
MNRRNFLKLGALFVPALVEPRRAYSFLWAKPTYVWESVPDARVRDDQVDAWWYAVAVATQLPLHILNGKVVEPPPMPRARCKVISI